MTRTSKIIAIFSPTGGMGVSLVASNLAYLLADRADSAILDLVLDFGSISDFLSFRPAVTVDRIPGSKFSNKSSILEQLSLPGRKTLKVFACPEAWPRQFDLSLLLDSCRKTFKYTILDLPHVLSIPEVRVSLSSADQILVIGQYNWGTILQISAFLEQVDDQQKPWALKSKVVMNKVEWLPQDVLNECHANLKVPVFAKLPQMPRYEGRRQLVGGIFGLRQDFSDLAKQLREVP